MTEKMLQYIKQWKKEMEEPVELFQNENNRLKMEAESLLQGTELLSVQEINTSDINGNA